jgi:RNA polymerase sigma factor (TIGR02999 family)
MSDVTRILNAIEAGDANAADRLLPLVYDQLRREAQRRMAGERSDHTLQATALVHEVYLRLVGDRQVPWQNRAHFYAAGAEAMRRILIEEARRKKAARHGNVRNARRNRPWPPSMRCGESVSAK